MERARNVISVEAAERYGTRPAPRPLRLHHRPRQDATPGLSPVVTVVEDEGLTLVVEQEDADAARLTYDYVAGWITLRIHSALDAVGLTAAVAQALAEYGLSCNVVAGFHHDHLFVPHERAAEAVALLEQLADRSGR